MYRLINVLLTLIGTSLVVIGASPIFVFVGLLSVCVVLIITLREVYVEGKHQHRWKWRNPGSRECTKCEFRQDLHGTEYEVGFYGSGRTKFYPEEWLPDAPKYCTPRLVPIPVDPMKPGVPREVIDANVADDIRESYRVSGKQVPDSLKMFLCTNYETYRGRDWEIKLLKVLCGGEDDSTPPTCFDQIPLHILDAWLLEGSGHFFRAELRAHIKRVRAEETQ